MEKWRKKKAKMHNKGVLYNKQKFIWQTEHGPSVKCVTLAHHALAHDWSNISLATIANAEWLVCSALCVIDSHSKQTQINQLVRVQCL